MSDLKIMQRKDKLPLPQETSNMKRQEEKCFYDTWQFLMWKEAYTVVGVSVGIAERQDGSAQFKVRR